MNKNTFVLYYDSLEKYVKTCNFPWKTKQNRSTRSSKLFKKTKNKIKQLQNIKLKI